MSTPEQHRPPVYACAAGAVLHAHAGDTLEPAVLLHTFLPPETTGALREAQVRVDVHSDGAASPTVTVRVLADAHSLSWQLPVAPLVAALPGQAGDDGRVVLLALIDAEPAPGSWAQAVDCESLAVELPLPVVEVVDALRGRLAPWLAEDVELLLHDDARDHAADQSPEQLLASAVCAHYHGSMDAGQATNRLVRGLSFGPPEFQTALAGLIGHAVMAAVDVAGAEGVAAVLAATGPFEDEAVRLLTSLSSVAAGGAPPGPDDEIMAGADREEAVRAAISVIARLGRTGLGPELGDEALLQGLDMVDDAALVRLARLWVRMAVAVLTGPAEDSAAIAEISAGVSDAGEPGRSWLRRTAQALATETHEVAGRALHRVGVPLELVRAELDRDGAGVSERAEPGPVVHACLQLARFVRSRAGIGPGGWAELPLPAAVQAVGATLSGGVPNEVGIELLDGLLEPDLDAAEALDAFVCATAQLLVQAMSEEGPDAVGLQVTDALAALPAGERGPRWVLVGCLRAAHQHDPAAADLTKYLSAEPEVNLDRAAGRAGVRTVLRDGLCALGAISEAYGHAAGVTRDDVFALVLPAALAEHDLLRRAR